MRQKMYKLFFFVIIILSTFSRIAFAGDKIGNGGGIAEQNISYAYVNLQTILNFCLTTTNCLNSNDQIQLVKKIESSLHIEYSNTIPLKFLSGAKNPEIFLIDGSMRTAVTGNNVGDVIYINTDLIYFKNVHSKSEPMSIASAMGLLTHELGHHQKVANHDFLDLIGAQIKAFALSSMDIIKIDTYLDVFDVRPPNLTLTAVHRSLSAGDFINGSETTLLFADEQKVHNLKPWLDKTLSTCPQSARFSSSKTIGYRLFDLRWGKWTINSGTQSQRVYRLLGRVSFFCEDHNDIQYPVRFDNSHEIIIELPVNFKNFPDLLGLNWILETSAIKLKLLPFER